MENVKDIFILCVGGSKTKCEFWVNVNRALATALAASKQLLISVAHILVNANG